jgi:site-specific DNA-cytosine methylase
MKTVELFAGTCSFSKVAKERGHKTFTSDLDSQFGTDYTVSIMDFDASLVPFQPDFIWASPPCETFSVASLGHHWDKSSGDFVPKTQAAVDGNARVIKTLEIIKELNPKFWLIENPRGALRKMPFMANLPRYTVSYCQYGDTRMKPTDLWTNIPTLSFRPMCRNGSPCHEAAPRGSRTGTQGIGTYKERSVVPEELCLEVVQLLESLEVSA